MNRGMERGTEGGRIERGRANRKSHRCQKRLFSDFTGYNETHRRKMKKDIHWGSGEGEWVRKREKERPQGR